MVGKVEHPDIRYVVYPLHLDGTPTGAEPRMRHYPDCGRFEWPDGVRLGTPVVATEEQMQTLRACKTCVNSRGGSSGTIPNNPSEARVGRLCPSCHQMLPLTGRCDNCD
jgi:hypothetical protein